MGIRVQYGDVGPLISGAMESLRRQRRNSGPSMGELQAKAAAIQADQQAAMARIGANTQSGINNDADNATRASIASADNETRAGLAEFAAYRDDLRDQRQEQRDFRLSNLNYQRDEERFARQMDHDSYMRAVTQGVPLTPQQQVELQQLQGGMADLDRQLSEGQLRPQEAMSMRIPMQRRHDRLSEQNSAATERQRREREQNDWRNLRHRRVPIDDPNEPELFDPQGNPMFYPDDHPLHPRGRMHANPGVGLVDPTNGMVTPVGIPRQPRPQATFSEFSRELERVMADNPGMSREDATAQVRANIDAFHQNFDRRPTPENRELNAARAVVNAELHHASQVISETSPSNSPAGTQQVQNLTRRPRDRQAAEALTVIQQSLARGRPLAQMTPQERAAFLAAAAALPEDVARRIQLPASFLRIPDGAAGAAGAGGRDDD